MICNEYLWDTFEWLIIEEELPNIIRTCEI